MKFETLCLDDSIRSNLGEEVGQFISLPHGKVHYKLHIPSKNKHEGEIIILVHGFSTPLFIYDKIVDPLLNEGYSVLQYDLYGRGFSDRSENLNYDINTYVDQLYSLIYKKRLEEKKIHLVGLSMGGPICVVFTKNNSDMVKSLALLAPAGLPSGNKRPSKILLKFPFSGKMMIKIILKNAYNNLYEPEKHPEYLDKFKEQMKYKGYSYALKKTFANFPFEGFKDEFKEVGKLPIPKLLIWGENDVIVNYSTHNKVIETMPEIKFVSIPSCGHVSPYEKPKIVSDNILKFLMGL